MFYDVSYCQKGLDLKDLPDCEGVIIRLGINDHMDTECKNFTSQCLRYGIPFGYYWFTYATNNSTAARESNCIVKCFTDLIALYGKPQMLQHCIFPLFIDYEADGKYTDMIVSENWFLSVNEFYRQMSKAGIVVGQYLNTSLIEKFYDYCSEHQLWNGLNCLKQNLWWADWTNRQKLVIMDDKYVLRQTGSDKFNGMTVDTDVRGTVQLMCHHKIFDSGKPEDKVTQDVKDVIGYFFEQLYDLTAECLDMLS